MIIGIAGDIGSGKDEVGRIICRLNPKWTVKKFAGKLKEIAGILLHLKPEDFERREIKDMDLGVEWNNMNVREFLQVLGTECIRDALCENAWVNSLLKEYEPDMLWVITDVRFPNEFEAVKKIGGKMLKISKNENKVISYHKSELSLSSHQFDYYIHNDGTLDELEQEVKKFLNEL